MMSDFDKSDESSSALKHIRDEDLKEGPESDTGSEDQLVSAGGEDEAGSEDDSDSDSNDEDDAEEDSDSGDDEEMLDEILGAAGSKRPLGGHDGGSSSSARKAPRRDSGSEDEDEGEKGDDKDPDDGVQFVAEDYEEIDRGNIIPRSRRRAALRSGLAGPSPAQEEAATGSGGAQRSRAYVGIQDDDEQEAEF